MKYDDASWHYGGKNFPKGASKRNGGVHIGIFLEWIIRHDLAHPELVKEYPYLKQMLLDGQANATDFLFDELAEKLTDEDLSAEGILFANYYFATRAYLVDFSEVVGDLEEYQVPHSKEIYAAVSKRIDEAYLHFQDLKRQSLQVRYGLWRHLFTLSFFVLGFVLFMFLMYVSLALFDEWWWQIGGTLVFGGVQIVNLFTIVRLLNTLLLPALVVRHNGLIFPGFNNDHLVPWTEILWIKYAGRTQPMRIQTSLAVFRWDAYFTGLVFKTETKLSKTHILRKLDLLESKMDMEEDYILPLQAIPQQQQDRLGDVLGPMVRSN